MEGATDPAMLKDRAFYKLGLFIHDQKKAMMAFGLVSCILMTGLIGMGADWAEGFGEDDVESVNAGRLISDRFSSEDESSGPSFRYLVFHSELNDTSEAWQEAVRAALADFENHPDVSIEYSWDAEEVDREDVVASDEDGQYALNKVVFNTNRKEAKSIMNDLHDSVDWKVALTDG